MAIAEDYRLRWSAKRWKITVLICVIIGGVGTLFLPVWLAIGVGALTLGHSIGQGAIWQAHHRGSLTRAQARLLVRAGLLGYAALTVSLFLLLRK
jgi:hypothetical protein